VLRRKRGRSGDGSEASGCGTRRRNRLRKQSAVRQGVFVGADIPKHERRYEDSGRHRVVIETYNPTDDRRIGIKAIQMPAKTEGAIILLDATCTSDIKTLSDEKDIGARRVSGVRTKRDVAMALRLCVHRAPKMRRNDQRRRRAY